MGSWKPIDTRVPETCPKPATETNCGFNAALWLMEGKLLRVDEDGENTSWEIDPLGLRTSEVLDPKGHTKEVYLNSIDFGCIACGKCIRVQLEPFDYITVGIIDQN